MDFSILRDSEASQLAAYLRDCAAKLGSAAVTQSLVSGIEAQSLPPSVYNIWLSSSGDCQAISHGIGQNISQLVRRASIRQFGRLFRGRRTEEIWKALGGTAGIVNCLATAAVRDVKHFCREIGRTATSNTATKTRQRYADELYSALQARNIAGSSTRTHDRRPLSSHYNRVFPACSESLIVSTVDKTDDATTRDLAFGLHTTLFRERFLEQLRNDAEDINIFTLVSLTKANAQESAVYHGRLIPANLAFRLNVLNILSERSNITGLNHGTFHLKIANPAFRAIGRLKSQNEILISATQSYMQYVQRHLAVGRYTLPLASDSVSWHLIRRWSRCPDELNESLNALLDLVPAWQVLTAREVASLLEIVHETVRLQFLRLALRVLSCFRLDLDSDGDLKKLDFLWSPQFFYTLPKPEARQLLKRVISVTHGQIFGIPGVDNIQEKILAGMYTLEPEYLLIDLSKYEPGSLQIAKEAVEERKKEARKARKQEDRSAWILYALHCSTASGSVDLFRETLLWTRQYAKDPVTVANIFSSTFLHKKESVDLLCGISGKEDFSTSSLEKSRVSIRMGNVVCEELFETARQAMAEPSFQPYHWQGVFSLMDAVVKSRFTLVNKLQDGNGLSDGAMFDLVWQDTLEVCLRLESLGLEEDNALLELNKVHGLLLGSVGWHWQNKPIIYDPRPATLRFLDTLAQRRNELWQKYRRAEFPAIVTLPAMYPKGLPLEYLLPVGLDECESGTHVPYLRSRAEAIVFLDPAFTLSPPPTEEDSLDAIGPCTESWPHALTVYVQSSEDRQGAAIYAWKHATGLLSKSRMSAAEAFLFWSPFFSSALGSSKVSGPWIELLKSPPNPVLPAFDGMDQPTEWNPDPDFKAYEVKSRKLDFTILDAMLEKRSNFAETIKSKPMQNFDLRVPAHTLPTFWARASERKNRTPPNKEALIAAVMLYISGRNHHSAGVLAQAFPNTSDARFPALYLDGDFLDRESLNDLTVWDALVQLLDCVPTTLLISLTRGVFETAAKEEKRTPPDAFKLLRLLVKSDQPQAALNLVQQVVLERPEDSAWQRSILTQSLLASLPPQVVQDFLQGLSIAMQDKLSLQIQTPPKAEDDSSERPAALIKVTTVKMLAKLLLGAEFVSDASACKILITLLASARHIDIRVSVLESLIEMLSATNTDAGVKGNIMAALETHVVPVIASINERRHLGEAEWRRLELEAKEMPEIYMESNPSELPPMLSAVFRALYRVDEQVKEQIFTRILIPALKGSIESNNRWLALFIRHLGLPTQVELPSLPLKLILPVQLLDYPGDVPPSVLDLWFYVFAATYAPSSAVQRITTSVEQDAKLRHSNAGKHWMSLFGPSAVTYLLNARNNPAALLTREGETGGLEIAHIQRLALRQAEYIVSRGTDPSFSHWNTFIQDFKPPGWTSLRNLQLWHQNVKPLLKTLIERLHSLRTDEWNQNGRRAPFVLPDTWLLRAWLLTPSNSRTHLGVETQRFGHDILGMLKELASSNRVSHERYNQFFTFFQSVGLPSSAQVQIALLLGNLRDNVGIITMLDDFRIDWAKRIVQGTYSAPSDELQREVVQMVTNWTRYADESVRMVGFGMVTKTAWYVKAEDEEPEHDGAVEMEDATF